MTQVQRISAVEAARMIRAELKETYPNVKFKVNTHKYSMGANILVHYSDESIPSVDVRALVAAFKGARFDPMTDSISYHASTFKDKIILSDANYVFVNNNAEMDDDS